MREEEEDGVNANAIILPSLPRKAPKWILLSRGGRAILGSKTRRWGSRFLGVLNIPRPHAKRRRGFDIE